MPSCPRAIVAVLMLLLAVPARAQAPAPVLPAAMIQGYANAAIAAHARRVGGQAPRESRKSCEGDVNGDGRSDAGVLYTIEGVGGGNGWTQYLLVLVAAPQGVGATNPREVGATGQRSAESCTLTNGAIEVATKEWAPADPSCCPSKPGTLHLALDKNKIVDAPVAAPTP